MQKQPHVELLRWMLLLPLAFFGGVATLYLGGIVWRFAVDRGGAGSESPVALMIQLLTYAMAAAVFVLLGAFIAPRNRNPTALVLAVAYAILSLFTHVISQDHPGTVNYLHLAAETTGATLATAYLFAMKRFEKSR